MNITRLQDMTSKAGFSELIVNFSPNYFTSDVYRYIEEEKQVSVILLMWVLSYKIDYAHIYGQILLQNNNYFLFLYLIFALLWHIIQYYCTKCHSCTSSSWRIKMQTNNCQHSLINHTSAKWLRQCGIKTLIAFDRKTESTVFLSLRHLKIYSQQECKGLQLT